MSQVHAKECCKLCGKPSVTVICMHCFLNYNYKMYAHDDQDFTELADGLEKLNRAATEEDKYWTAEREKMEEKSEDEEESDCFHHFSLQSIFTRLPKFE